jgi:peptidoglycan/LPS O-acetylase OafA/YrhL
VGLRHPLLSLSPVRVRLTAAPAHPSRSGHLPALTGLRFFLALWVIATHLIGTGHVYEPVVLMLPSPLQDIIRRGYQAVPTFFVLSGFVLARTYGHTEWTRRNFRKYLAGRFARVYPVYLLSLLIVSPFIVKAQDLHKGWLVAMHLTLTQGWFAGHYTAGWNTPAWSLSCEIFFYLIFPLLMVPMKNRGWRRTLGAALLACVLTQAMWAAGVSDQIKPIVHLSDFLMGIAVARAFDLLQPFDPHQRRSAPSGTWFYRIGFLGSAVILAYAQYLPDSISMNTLLRPMSALLLLGLGLGGGLLARILSARPVVYLGKASYAMYILHIPILWWAVSWPSFAVTYLYVPFVVGLSCVLYQVFEEPANRFIRSLVAQQKEIAPVPEEARIAA